MKTNYIARENVIVRFCSSPNIILSRSFSLKISRNIFYKHTDTMFRNFVTMKAEHNSVKNLDFIRKKKKFHKKKRLY